VTIDATVHMGDDRKGTRPVAGWADGRLAWVDLLRGLAIASMVAANAGAQVLRPPHPLAFRLFGSLAAPTFVTLAGMMVAYATRADKLSHASGAGRPHDLRYYLTRGGWVLLAAIGVDVVIGQAMPLMTFDVLYVIGLSLPAMCLLSRASPWGRWLAPIGVFAATPLLQEAWGYDLRITQVPLDTPFERLLALTPIATRRLLLDGWFPLFPWLGFAALGVALETLGRPPASGTRVDLRAGLFVTGLGAAIWCKYPGPLQVRAGYSEMFYPATLGFLVTATGAILTLLRLAERWSSGPLAGLFVPLGRCPLLIYVVHYPVIDHLLRPRVPDLAMGPFLTAYTALLGCLWLLAVGVDRLKRTFRVRRIALPLPIAILLGG
jgi:uncharacterized membrane protein